MDTKNPGLETSMFIFLMVGYFFFMIYIIAICLITNYLFQRGMLNQDNQSHEENLQKILRSLSRVKFSDGAFGQMGPENECIICMQSYGSNDMITTLSCNEKHFFHTQCIEKWIQNRNVIDMEGPKCPICRQVIKEDDRQHERYSDQQERRSSNRGSVVGQRQNDGLEMPRLQHELQ